MPPQKKPTIEKSCSMCSKTTRRLIISSDYGDDICATCYNRERTKTGHPEHGLPPAGEVLTDALGRPICHICGRAYRKVLCHARSAHGISAAEYKLRFGLYLKRGVCAELTRNKLRASNERNFDLVVGKNLLEMGANSRFEPGSPGRTADKIGLQLRRALAKNFSDWRERQKVAGQGSAKR